MKIFRTSFGRHVSLLSNDRARVAGQADSSSFFSCLEPLPGLTSVAQGYPMLFSPYVPPLLCKFALSDLQKLSTQKRPGYL